MNEKITKITEIHLPSQDSLEQALSYISNVSNMDEIKPSELKKAMECINNGETESENILMDNETVQLITGTNPINNEPDISELFSEQPDSETEDYLNEQELTVYKSNLPADADYVKEMDDTIEKSLYAHRELFGLAANASTGVAVAEISNASASFLKLAQDARQAKFKHRLDLHKASIEERKMKLAELKAFKDLGSAPSEDGFSSETISGIKVNPSLREQLLKDNKP